MILVGKYMIIAEIKIAIIAIIVAEIGIQWERVATHSSCAFCNVWKLLCVFQSCKNRQICSVLFLRLCFLVCVITTNVKTPLLRWCCDIKIVPSSNWNSFLQLYHILYSMWIAQPMLSLGGWYSTPASFHLPARESQVNEPREWRWSEHWGKRRRKREQRSRIGGFGIQCFGLFGFDQLTTVTVVQ